MSRDWRNRLSLLAGLALIVLAGWIVLQGGNSAGPESRPGASAATSSNPAPNSTGTGASSTGSEASGGDSTPTSGLPTMTVGELPAEGRETLALIERGGPFPHRRDGLTFGNRERLLPAQSRGYYREYTVETPGASDRGARRLVAGDGGDLYYTADHYASFHQVQEER